MGLDIGLGFQLGYIFLGDLRTVRPAVVVVLSEAPEEAEPLLDLGLDMDENSVFLLQSVPTVADLYFSKAEYF